MRFVDVTCTDTNKTIQAEVFKESDKYITVLIHGNKLTMRRSDVRALFVGTQFGMEFFTTGESK